MSKDLGISEPPFIEDLGPENIHVLRGKKFQLRAKFAGEPPPTIKWHKDKDILESSKKPAFYEKCTTVKNLTFIATAYEYSSCASNSQRSLEIL